MAGKLETSVAVGRREEEKRKTNIPVETSWESDRQPHARDGVFRQIARKHKKGENARCSNEYSQRNIKKGGFGMILKSKLTNGPVCLHSLRYCITD